MARYEYLQHMTSGDVYAVEMGDGERVVMSVGPIPRGEMGIDPSEAAVNMTDEDNDWFNEGDEFRLLSGAELAQVVGRARERAEA